MKHILGWREDSKQGDVLMKQILCVPHAQQFHSWAHPHQAHESTKTRTGMFLSAQTEPPMPIGSGGREPLVIVTEWETAERKSETSLQETTQVAFTDTV